MKWKIILLILMCLPIVTATICEDRIDNGTTCLMVTPELVCTTYNYSIFLKNGSPIAPGSDLTLVSGSVYSFNFTNETGDYIINLCDGSTREFRVTESYDTKFQNEESARMAIAIAIFLIGITAVLFILGLKAQNRNFQMAFFLFGFLFVVADLFFAARLTEEINPAYTGIISNLDTMYAIGLYTFVFFMSLAGVVLLFMLFRYLKNFKKIRLENEEEDWFRFR